MPLTLQFLLPQKWTHGTSPAPPSAPATALAWPARTPHHQPWPDPTDRIVESHFGRTLIQAWTLLRLGQNPIGTRITHKITDERYGWPLTCVRRTQFYWPYGAREWASDAPWDTGVRLAWAGVLLNPMIVAGSLWALFYVPFWTRYWWLARRRRRKGNCPACGYPIGTSPVCTECGAPVPTQAVAAAASGEQK